MMARFPAFDCSGVIPAALLPFHDDLSIDAASYRAHLRDLGSVRGSAPSPPTPMPPKSLPATRPSRTPCWR